MQWQITEGLEKENIFGQLWMLFLILIHNCLYEKRRNQSMIFIILPDAIRHQTAKL